MSTALAIRTTVIAMLCASLVTPALAKAPKIPRKKAPPAEAPAPGKDGGNGNGGAHEIGNGVPEGYVTMTVHGVAEIEDSYVVMLTDEAETVAIPIGVGDSEALSIHHRLERRRFERPLTHDLLDALVRELGGEVVEVRIDDLRLGVFVATVYVRGQDKIVRMDSRASDAIALALGNQLPIYFATAVVEQTGIPWEMLEPEEPEPEPTDEDTPEPPTPATQA